MATLLRNGLISLLAIIASTSGALASPYQLQWARQIGTPMSDYAVKVDVDSWGNAYVSGQTGGDLAGTYQGNGDAYLVKYDNAGNLVWSQQLGGPDSDQDNAVAVDAAGNAYMVGFSGAGVGDLGRGVYLAKYNSSGSLLWLNPVNGNDSVSPSIAVDPAGNTYIGGCDYSWIPDPMGGIGRMSSQAQLIKYDNSGSVLWTRQVESWEGDLNYTRCVAVGPSGDAYTTDPTHGLNRWDASGNLSWSQPFNGEAHSVAVDAAGNAYVAGQAFFRAEPTGPVNFDTGLAKYDSAGNLLWWRHYGGSGEENARAVAVDADGNVFISGYTYDGPGGYLPNLDILLIKYNAMGNLVWSQEVGTPFLDEATGLDVDAWGNVYVSGSTYGAFDGQNAGQADTFLLKFAVPEPATLSLLALGGMAMLRRRK